MISLELSVREALLVYENATHNIPLREKIAQAIERATVHPSTTEEVSLTVYSRDYDNFITLCGFSRSDCEKLRDQLGSLGCDCSVSG